MKSLIGEAIILDSIRHRDAGARILISTDKNGHIYVVAPNAQKSKRRFIGGLNIFSRIEYMATYKNDMIVLNESTLTDEYEKMFKDTGAYITASVLCEIAQKLYSVNNPDESAFVPLKSSFEHIKSGIDLDCIYSFLRESMIRIGEPPLLDRCAICQKDPNKGHLLFNYFKGGILCKDCTKFDKRGEYIFGKVLEFMLSDSPKKPVYPKSIKRQAIFLLERYLRFKLNIGFISLKFI